MEPHVFAALLAAAAMHAGWNALLKLRLEPLLGMTLVAVGSGLAALPGLSLFGWPAAPAWPWLAGSTAVHLAYYLALSAAYARADMSQIYPIARGGAPLLTAAASGLVLAEPVTAAQLAGIAVLGSGVALMSVAGRRPGDRFDPTAVGFALATAVVICGYTLVDGMGARAAGDPHAYSAALFTLNAFPLPMVALWKRGWTALLATRAFAWQGLCGGAMSLCSYWIAIWAMTVAPIPLVAALRETSVLFGAAIALVILREPPSRPRLAAAGLILAGLLLIRLT